MARAEAVGPIVSILPLPQRKVALILTGSPEKVKAYCKELIDVVGKGGGYIMSFGTSMDEGKPETIHAMVDFTKEYGVY